MLCHLGSKLKFPSTVGNNLGLPGGGGIDLILLVFFDFVIPLMEVKSPFFFFFGNYISFYRISL